MNAFEQALQDIRDIRGSTRQSVQLQIMQTGLLVKMSTTMGSIHAEIIQARKQQAEALAIQQEMLARERLQAYLEEFIYQAQKLVAECGNRAADMDASTRFFLLDGLMAHIEREGIATPIIKGRDNKVAFDKTVNAANWLITQLRKDPEVQQAIAWAKQLQDERERERIEREGQQELERARRRREQARRNRRTLWIALTFVGGVFALLVASCVGFCMLPKIFPIEDKPVVLNGNKAKNVGKTKNERAAEEMRLEAERAAEATRLKEEAAAIAQQERDAREKKILAQQERDAREKKILGNLTHPDLELRRKAALAIGELGDRAKEAVPDLATAILDTDRPLRLAALKALRNLGPASEAAVPNLTKALASKEADTRQAAIETLAAIGPEAKSAAAALVSMFADKDDRLGASKALVKIAKDAVPALIKGLENTSPLVRQISARTLGEIGPDARSALPALRTRAQTDTSISVREDAQEAITRIK